MTGNAFVEGSCFLAVLTALPSETAAQQCSTLVVNIIVGLSNLSPRCCCCKRAMVFFWLTCLQVINLRTLKPLDRDTIVNSIKKTHRLVSVEEGWPQCGIGAEMIAIANEECFDDLDAPPERVTGAEVPMPYAANLEAAALPQVRVLTTSVGGPCCFLLVFPSLMEALSKITVG